MSDMTYFLLTTALYAAKRRVLGYASPVSDVAPASAQDGAMLLKPCFRPEQVDRMLRVEVSHECLDEIMRDADPSTRMGFIEAERAGGPGKIMGVDVYTVRGLPAPGWRIINPMEKA